MGFNTLDGMVNLSLQKYVFFSLLSASASEFLKRVNHLSKLGLTECVRERESERACRLAIVHFL